MRVGVKHKRDLEVPMIEAIKKIMNTEQEASSATTKSFFIEGALAEGSTQADSIILLLSPETMLYLSIDILTQADPRIKQTSNSIPIIIAGKLYDSSDNQGKISFQANTNEFTHGEDELYMLIRDEAVVDLTSKMLHCISTNAEDEVLMVELQGKLNIVNV